MVFDPRFFERNIFWYTGQLILSKVIKIAATRGSEGVYSAPLDPLAGFREAADPGLYTYESHISKFVCH